AVPRSIKRFEHSLAVGSQDARTVVIDNQHDRVQCDADGNLAASAGVLDGVVDQVAENFRQQAVFSGDDHAAFGAVVSQVDIACDGQIRPALEFRACKLRQ